jgi:hypothetical protein
MSKTTELTLTGAGAAYVRVSTDKQDTDRQLQSIRDFAARHGVTIADHYWFEDRGWSRHADREPPSSTGSSASRSRGG